MNRKNYLWDAIYDLRRQVSELQRQIIELQKPPNFADEYLKRRNLNERFEAVYYDATRYVGGGGY